MSQIITFYSYKGGVGRTMALANISVLLSQWGYKTLIVDWDLEAPGLEFYFKDFLDPADVASKKGIIDILMANESSNESWQEYLIPISIPQSEEPIHLLSAGKRDDDYLAKVRGFDIDSFYEKTDGGKKIESLREEWKEAYDFILIDSRTGITDNGGICTIHFPDILVLLFTATHQGFNGILEVADRSLKAQQNIPYDRQKLISLPIPSRFDTHTEFKISQDWLDQFSEGLTNIYRDWLPTTIKPRQLLEVTKIPHVTYFSFGEKLPVVEQGVNDPTSLGYSYETIAAILANDFNNVEYLLEDRDEFVNFAIKNKLGSIKDINQNKINFYISYSHSDRKQKERLDKYLGILGKEGIAEFWSDKDILPGMDWQSVLDNKRSSSQVFLVLMSPDYFNSSYLMYELSSIFEMQEKGRLIIPIMLRSVHGMPEAAPLERFQFLPRDGSSVSKRDDNVYAEIADELRKVIKYILDNGKV